MLSSLKKGTNPFDFKSVGYKGGVTFQQSFSKIYTDSLYEKILYPKLWTWTLSASIGVDRFDNFDPIKNEIDNVFPVKAGVNGGLSRYIFSSKKEWYNGTFIPTANAKINFIEYNKLQNFLLNENVNSNSQVTFTNNSFDGKFGVLDNDIQSSYLSFAFPYVPNNKTYFSYIAPIPHVSWETFSNSSPRYNGGIALGFLSKGIIGSEGKKDKDKNKKVIPNTYYKSFNAPSFLSIGVDWNFAGGKTKKPQYSVSGTFRFN